MRARINPSSLGLFFPTVLKVQGGDEIKGETVSKSNKAERQRNHFIIGALVAGVLVYVLLGQNIAYAAIAAVAGGLLAQQFWD
jgi:hypothetical protein